MPDIPTTEPQEIIVGDTLQWNRPDLSSDYPASIWTLKYYFAGPNGAFNITAAANGEYFAITVTAAVTSTYLEGDYKWSAYVSKGAGATLERHEIDNGVCTVKPNIANKTAGYDPRSHCKKVLDAIEAAIEGRASRTDLAYTIQGISVSRIPPTELIKWHSHYKQLYKQEQDAEKIKNGLGTGRKILTRFV